jgi:anti-sigma regulatory factor (Ser/Thr protein kinase)
MTSAAFDVHDSSQVSATRREAATFATRLGFGEQRASQVTLVVSELASNLVKHAREGQILLRALPAQGTHGGIEILAIDRGPGLRSVTESLRDGHSTSGSLGAGLGAIDRQSDLFDVFSQPSVGTVVLSRIWDGEPREPATPEGFKLAAISVAMPGESCCGDGWAADLGPYQADVFVADGLGHGPGAAEAAIAAIKVFEDAHLSRSSAESPRDARAPAEIVDDVHQALRPTRGAAVSAARLDRDRHVVRFAGLGNVSGAIVTPDRRRTNLASMNGTAGHIARRVQEFSYPLTAGCTLVMHSDGLSTHWNPADYPDLWTRDPALIAGALYRDHNRRRDDATIVVVQCTP